MLSFASPLLRALHAPSTPGAAPGAPRPQSWMHRGLLVPRARSQRLSTPPLPPSPPAPLPSALDDIRPMSPSPVATAVSPDPSATVTFRGESSAEAERAHLPTPVALVSSSPSVRACCTAPCEQSGQARGQSVVCEEAHEIASNRKENDFLLSHTTDHPVRRALVTR